MDWLNASGVVVGSESSARARVSSSLLVRNAGEMAYSVTLNVTFPRPDLQFAAASPSSSTSAALEEVCAPLSVVSLDVRPFAYLFCVHI